MLHEEIGMNYSRSTILQKQRHKCAIYIFETKTDTELKKYIQIHLVVE